MTPRRDTFARLGVEPLEARTLLHAGPVDTNAFALWEDAARNTEVAEYRVMAEHTQAVVDNTSKTLHAILGGMPALDAAVSQAQNTTGALRQSVDLLRGSASATDTSLSQLQAQRKDIAQHLADIDASTHTLQEQLSGEQAALHTLQKQEDSLLKERGALRTKQDELQTANAQTLQTMAGLSRTIAELQQHMETQTACMTALEASLTSARAELQALHSSIATMDTELHALSQNVTATTEQQTFLEAEHARLTGEIVTQDTVVSAAKAEQQTAQTAYSQAVTQLDAATKNVATQTAIVSNRQTQLTGQQATLTSLQKQYDAALKLRPRNTPLEKSLKTQISSIKTQITTTNTQLTAAKQTLAISLQAHTAAQNTVTAKKAILEGKDATLQQAIDGKTLLQTQEAAVVANIGNADMQLSQLQANTAETQSLRRAAMANIAATEHRITDLESEQADGRSALDAYAGQSGGAMSALQSAARAHENAQIALQSNANALQNNDRELQEVTTATAFRSATIHTMQTTLRDLASQREEQTGALQTLEADIREKRAAQDAIFSSLASTRSALDEALEALATHIVERDQRQADAAAASHDLSIALEEDRVVDETLATIERIDAALDAREAQDAMVQNVLRAIREADVTPSFRSLGDEALRAAAQSSAPVSFSAALGTADGRVSLDGVGGFLTVSRAEGGKVSLATLDLAGAHTKVTAVSGQAPGASSVAVFRGTRQLAELPLGNDGSFSYADTEGITAVLVGSRTTTAVNITSFSATADPLAEQPEGAALKPMTSRYAAQYQKPTFTPSDNYDYGVKTRTLQHYGIRQYSGGDNYNGTYMHAVNTSAYTVFRLRVNSGDVRFSKAQYMREDQGLIDLDRRYYEISPDGRQIRFAPGTPKHIVLSSGGNGSASYEMKEGENLADLLPPDRAVVDLSWQKLYATGPEGVFAGENGITESTSAPFMEGDSVNVMYSIENSGGAGGNVTVDFHVGYTGDPAQDAKQKSFTVSAAAGSYQFLRANLSAPPAPAAGMHPIITYVIRYPDGSMGTGHKLGNPLKLNNMDYRTYDPVSGKLVWHAKDLTPEQERAVARATDKALAALASGQYANDPKVQLVFNAHPGLRETIAAHFGSAAVLSDTTEETLAAIAGEHLLQEAMPAAMELHSDDPAVQAILDGLTYGDLVAMAGMSDSGALTTMLKAKVADTLKEIQSPFVIEKMTPTDINMIAMFVEKGIAERILASSDPTLAAIAFGNEIQRKFPSTLDIKNALSVTRQWKLGSPEELGLPRNMNTTSGIGKLFLGMLTTLNANAANPAEMAKTMQVISKLTDIPLWKLSRCMLYEGVERTSQFARLFTTANYGHIFKNTGDRTGVINAVLSKGAFTVEETIKIRLDYTPPANKTLQSITVIPEYSGAVKKTLSPSPIVQDSTGAFFVTFSVKDAIAQFQNEEQHSMSFRIFATFSDSSTDSFLTAPAQLEGEGYTTFLWIDPNGTTDTIEGKGSIIRDAAGNFLQLTDDKGNVLIDATNVTSEGSKAILGYLAERFFGEFALQKTTSITWKGIPQAAGGQCKVWVDDKIVQSATGIDLPGNEGNEALTGKWIETDENGNDTLAILEIAKISRIESGDVFSTVFKQSNILEGDIVQYHNGDYPHTMIITKIQEDGIWVMDSNFGPQTPVVDNTIRCHFMKFEELNRINVGTIYRVNSDLNGQ